MFVREGSGKHVDISGEVWLCEADSESCEDLGQCCISSEVDLKHGDIWWSQGTQVAGLTGQCHLANIHERASICSVYLHCFRYARGFMFNIFSLYHSPAKQMKKLKAQEKLSLLLKVTQLMNNGATGQSQVCVIPKPCSCAAYRAFPKRPEDDMKTIFPPIFHSWEATFPGVSWQWGCHLALISPTGRYLSIGFSYWTSLLTERVENTQREGIHQRRPLKE